MPISYVCRNAQINFWASCKTLKNWWQSTSILDSRISRHFTASSSFLSGRQLIFMNTLTKTWAPRPCKISKNRANRRMQRSLPWIRRINQGRHLRCIDNHASSKTLMSQTKTSIWMERARLANQASRKRSRILRICCRLKARWAGHSS